MLLGRVLEIGGGPHEPQRLVVLALGPRGPGRRGPVLDLHLVGPGGLVGGDERGAILLELPGFRASLRCITGAGRADRAGEGRDRLGPREAVPRERARGGGERGGLAPAVL